jgi:hypothetical protein
VHPAQWNPAGKLGACEAVVAVKALSEDVEEQELGAEAAVAGAGQPPELRLRLRVKHAVGIRLRVVDGQVVGLGRSVHQAAEAERSGVDGNAAPCIELQQLQPRRAVSLELVPGQPRQGEEDQDAGNEVAVNALPDAPHTAGAGEVEGPNLGRELSSARRNNGKGSTDCHVGDVA